jgi:hypothetical protein
MAEIVAVAQSRVPFRRSVNNGRMTFKGVSSRSRLPIAFAGGLAAASKPQAPKPTRWRNNHMEEQS